MWSLRLAAWVALGCVLGGCDRGTPVAPPPAANEQPATNEQPAQTRDAELSAQPQSAQSASWLTILAFDVPHVVRRHVPVQVSMKIRTPRKEPLTVAAELLADNGTATPLDPWLITLDGKPAKWPTTDANVTQVVGCLLDSDELPDTTRLRISVTAGDTTQSIEAQLTINNRKPSVLLIDGRVRYEYRFLSELLQRERSVRFQAFNFGWDRSGPPLAHSRWIPGDGEEAVPALSALPETKTEDDRARLFRTYDVIIIGDVRRQHLPDTFLQAVREFVREHAGGVIFVAGEQYNPLAFGGSPLEDLLPFELASHNRNQVIVGNVVKPWQATDAGRIAWPLMLEKDPEKNDWLWKAGLHGFYWFQPIQRVRDGATVWMVHPRNTEYSDNERRMRLTVQTDDGDEYPLMVTQLIGRGRSLYIGSDDLWYIRGAHGNRYYQPLWLNLIRYAAQGRE